jgi:type I restriction enzyme, S subunit
MSGMQNLITDHIPAGWSVRPFWSLFRRKKRTGFAEEELLSVYRDHGVVPKSSRNDNFNKESEDLSGYQLVDKGWLVTNKMKAWQGSIAISRFRGIVSPAYYTYEPLSSENDQFLHYLLRSEPYVALYGRISKGVRVNQWDLEHEALRNVPVILPDIATQTAIADFLDRETARIDQLIEKKNQHLIAIAHRRSAQINHFLSCGLDDSVSRKIAASAFLGEIPSHWSEERLRFSIRKIEQGWSPQCNDWRANMDEWAVLKVGAVSTGVFKEEEHKALPSELSAKPELEVQPGDVLAARASGSTSLVGRAAYVEAVRPRLMISDKHYRLIVNDKRLLPQFLVFVINSPKSRAQIEVRLSSAEGMARNIGQDVLKNLWYGVPPIEEQGRIVEVLDRTGLSVKRMTDKVQTSIDRLRELQSSLVTATVTGQANISTWRNRGSTERRLDAIEAKATA